MNVSNLHEGQMSDCDPHSVRPPNVGWLTVAAPICLFVEKTRSCMPFPLFRLIWYAFIQLWVGVEGVTDRRLLLLKPETKEKHALNCSNCDWKKRCVRCLWLLWFIFHPCELWVIAIMLVEEDGWQDMALLVAYTFVPVMWLLSKAGPSFVSCGPIEDQIRGNSELSTDLKPV